MQMLTAEFFIRLDCHFTVFVDQTFALPLYVMPPHGVPESKLVYVDDGATALVIVRLEDQLGYNPFVSNEKTRHGRKRQPSWTFDLLIWATSDAKQ